MAFKIIAKYLTRAFTKIAVLRLASRGQASVLWVADSASEGTANKSCAGQTLWGDQIPPN